MRSMLPCTLVFFLSTFGALALQLPPKIWGVNLGSWLVLENWMLPAEWVAMGGELCGCGSCISSELSFAKAFPQDVVDDKFKKHWETWLSKDDVREPQKVGINTVRIPLGFWIVEALVQPPAEAFPRGGLDQLRRGLKDLNDAGIAVILDHHALPGAQTGGQMFTGTCSNDVEFYTPFNYGRALTWTAVMTALSHLDPAFAPVVAIQAVNEPIMDASRTPGYGTFQKDFVMTVRAVELLLGIFVPGLRLDVQVDTSNFTMALNKASASSIFSPEVKAALQEAIPILRDLGGKFSLDAISNIQHHDAPHQSRSSPLITAFMDRNWQFNNPPNPADAAIGQQGYDNHLYYSFGGVADPNPDAYMRSICNLNRVQADDAFGNSPLWFGEWGLPTQFSATDAFLRDWADAQKIAYDKGRGWLFWNFKVEISDLAGDLARQWSYLEGVKRGFLTVDPTKRNNPNVCDPFINNATTTTTLAAMTASAMTSSATTTSANVTTSVTTTTSVTMTTSTA